MTTTVDADRSEKPESQRTQTLSTASIGSRNGGERFEYDASNITSIDRKDEELEEARCAVTRLSSSTDQLEWLYRSRILASLLSRRFLETGREILLAECIDIQRQICAIYNTDHVDRAIFVSDLASSLLTYARHTGDDSLLAEAIDLNRDALSLRPVGHPDRSKSCSEVSKALRTRFHKTGEESLLEEAIMLDREALSLRPPGHPDRSTSCNNLAVALHTRFNQTGEEPLLAEVIDLHREALSLRPIGHPLRVSSCGNLATSLVARFNQTGEESLIAEAIDLDREALSLRPKGHPDLSMKYNNLAVSLFIRFKQTGNNSLLSEAINLHWEALSLRPSGHPDRSQSCTNLAFSLCTLFEQTEDRNLLDKAIELHREALSLQTGGHPYRLDTCNRLVSSLRTLFELTGDESLLVEAINLTDDVMEAQPWPHPRRWDAIINLSHIFLSHRFSRYNPVLAIDYIQQALSLTSDDWPTLLSEVAQLTSLLDLPMLSRDSLSQLLQCFSAAIDLASRVAGFILDPQLQLRYLSSSQHLGPRAYWCALACSQPELGLELIERARAVVWTQALHMRDPQLGGAPSELASELEVLLSSMHTLRVTKDPMSLSSHDQDMRHKNSDRIHQLIQQIRALPGQERFMRGLSSKELAQCACRNVVVMLIAAEGECHALILQPNNQELVTLELSGVASNDLTAMSGVVSAAQKRGSAWEGAHDDERGLKASPFRTSLDDTRPHRVLGKLWTAVVKPIIDCLHFQVCAADGTILEYN
jgi:tetratricopeptide (TPR) repeat protein